MFTVCWSVKGGCGTSVVAAALALRDRALLVDFGGDAAAVLGMPEPAGPGVTDWLAADDEIWSDALVQLGHDAGLDGPTVVPRGCGTPREQRWSALAESLRSIAEVGRPVVVDAGAFCLSSDQLSCLADAADSVLLVVRPCYLALRRAALVSQKSTGIVLVAEPGRAIGKSEVERVIGAPVVAVIPFDPAVARSVDAGLLSARVPRTLAAALRNAA